MNIDWKRKLTSRKFWLAVTGLIAGIIIACNGGEETAKTISGILMSAGSIVAYILGESWTDAAADGSQTTVTSGYITPAEDEEIDEVEEFNVPDESEYK